MSRRSSINAYLLTVAYELDDLGKIYGWRVCGIKAHSVRFEKFRNWGVVHIVSQHVLIVSEDIRVGEAC